MFLCLHCGDGASLNDGNGTNPNELDGKMLRKIGMNIKLPILRLIGKTIENLEDRMENSIENIENETTQKICKLNSCLEWTTWSKCSSNVHLFGTKSRTRQCTIDKTACKFDTTNINIEREFGLCGGFCPPEYYVTKNGFCLRFYMNKKRAKESAELRCIEDGGHLINIDSEMKFKDVKSLQRSNNCVWIDGQKKDLSSPWKYTYGSQKGFIKWYSGHPGNDESRLCLCYNLRVAHWFDNPCTEKRYSICEITIST